MVIGLTLLGSVEKKNPIPVVKGISRVGNFWKIIFQDKIKMKSLEKKWDKMTKICHFPGKKLKMILEKKRIKGSLKKVICDKDLEPKAIVKLEKHFEWIQNYDQPWQKPWKENRQLGKQTEGSLLLAGGQNGCRGTRRHSRPSRGTPLYGPGPRLLADQWATGGKVWADQDPFQPISILTHT